MQRDRYAQFPGFLFLSEKRGAAMQIVKKINTSAALALDSAGREVIVLGKGIGFPAVPYELTDLSRIERTFYDVDPKYLGMIAELPQPIVMASADIADAAEIELNCRLNPNLPFTLADHLAFAVERLKNGIDLTTPIAYDIRHLYPKEAGLGEQALEILQQQTGLALPASEAVSVAMHLINAEAESGDLHSLLMTIKIISEVEKIVEKNLGITLDKESYHYSRFAMHLRYLINRLASGTQTEERGAEMLRTLAREYPAIYLCAQQVARYFKGTWGWECNDEEVLYLMLHINRVQERSQE